MVKKLSKNILITGVSTGIGYGTAQEFINRGYRVFGSVRKQADADKLSSAWGNSFVPLIFDVTNQEDVDKAAAKVTEMIDDEGLACLVNNSGIAMGGPLQLQSMKDIEYHFEVNVFGLMRVTKAFLPLLGARENHTALPGRILNISSVGGKIAQPFVGAYIGTKHAVEGMSHSLRRELLLFGIDVIIIGPGAVKTPIWEKGIAMDAYDNTLYSKAIKSFAYIAKNGAEKGLSIEYLGKGIVDIFEMKKPKTRYPFVSDKLKNWLIPSMMPDRAMDKIIKKMFRM